MMMCDSRSQTPALGPLYLKKQLPYSKMYAEYILLFYYCKLPHHIRDVCSALQRRKAVTHQSAELRKMTLKFSCRPDKIVAGRSLNMWQFFVFLVKLFIHIKIFS